MQFYPKGTIYTLFSINICRNLINLELFWLIKICFWVCICNFFIGNVIKIYINSSSKFLPFCKNIVATQYLSQITCSLLVNIKIKEELLYKLSVKSNWTSAIKLLNLLEKLLVIKNRVKEKGWEIKDNRLINI